MEEMNGSNYQDTISLPLNYSSQLVNSTDNTTECSNEYCVSDEEYVAMIEDYIFPTPTEWVLITCHIIVFIVGVLGNAAVCIFVYRRHSMRTVTNIFLANLAVADFMVVVFCLPPSVLWDVTNTWFFGQVLCKFVLYIQSVSVSISVLTLTFIAVDRWYAVCHPVKFKTSSRIKPFIAIIWIASFSLVLPEAIFLDIHYHPNVPDYVSYFTTCDFSWTTKESTIYQIYILLILYLLPLIVISILYYRIVITLWTNQAPGSSEISQRALSKRKRKRHASERTSEFSCLHSQIDRLHSRRKVAKMLIVVVFIFSICYLPVHVLNLLRYTIILPNDEITNAAVLISHWLCYANSATNPFIYNFMNRQFRKEFKKLFRIDWLRNKVPSSTSYFSFSKSRSAVTLSTQSGTIKRDIGRNCVTR